MPGLELVFTLERFVLDSPLAPVVFVLVLVLLVVDILVAVIVAVEMAVAEALAEELDRLRFLMGVFVVFVFIFVDADSFNFCSFTPSLPLFLARFVLDSPLDADADADADTDFSTDVVFTFALFVYVVPDPLAEEIDRLRFCGVFVDAEMFMDSFFVL